MALERISRANWPHCLSLYEDLKSALQRHRRERIEAFSVSLVSRLLFSVFALYSNRQRRSLYREKSICALGKNPHRLCHEVRFVFSLVVFVCLSLSPRACTSRERESACCSWYFNLGFIESLVVSLCLCFSSSYTFALEGSRERELIGGTTGKTNESRKRNENRARISPFFAECMFCRRSIRGGMQNWLSVCVSHVLSLILLFSLSLFYIKRLDKGNDAE